jgi:hypothetical protein
MGREAVTDRVQDGSRPFNCEKVPMIHYSCDCCKRVLESEDLRYIVKMEVYAAFEPSAMDELDDDRDHLQEIQEILQRDEDVPDPAMRKDFYEELRFDLCAECRKKFVKNPLGREHSKQFDFSKN